MTANESRVVTAHEISNSIISDSSALNDIIKGYCEIAIEQGSVKGILDTYPSKEVLKRYYGASETEPEHKEKPKSKSV